jgi:hypothetical protein
LSAFRGEPDFGEAQEDEAEDGRGVFLRFKAGIGAELIGGIPETFFECGGGSILLRWGDPVHMAVAQGILNRFNREGERDGGGVVAANGGPCSPWRFPLSTRRVLLIGVWSWGLGMAHMDGFLQSYEVTGPGVPKNSHGMTGQTGEFI